MEDGLREIEEVLKQYGLSLEDLDIKDIHDLDVDAFRDVLPDEDLQRIQEKKESCCEDDAQGL